jgi:hypothetical protein
MIISPEARFAIVQQAYAQLKDAETASTGCEQAELLEEKREPQRHKRDKEI